MSTAVYQSRTAIFPIASFSTILQNYFAMSLMVLMVLFSAFGVIYVKNIDRQLISSLQNAQQTRNNLHIQWSQLLLEESSLSSRVRVADIAKQKLGMVLPVKRKIITL